MINKLLATVFILGLCHVSVEAKACADYSGYYQRANFSMTFKQIGCNSLDVTYITAGTQPIQEHSDLSNPTEGWSWSGGNLVFRQDWGPHKDEINYALDPNGNLVQVYFATFKDGSILNLGKTTFKKF